MTTKHAAPEGENAAVVAFIARFNRRPTTEEFQLYAAGYYDSQGKQQAEGTRPLTSEEREVMREAIRDSAELVAPGRMAVDRSQPVAGDAAIIKREIERTLADLSSSMPVTANNLARDIERLVRALSVAASAPEGWMPISTAPKDVEYLLLSDGTNVTVGGWHSDMDHGAEWEGQIGMAGWWTLDWRSTNKPTHWQPLPASPSLPVSGDGKEGQHG